MQVIREILLRIFCLVTLNEVSWSSKINGNLRHNHIAIYDFTATWYFIKHHHIIKLYVWYLCLLESRRSAFVTFMQKRVLYLTSSETACRIAHRRFLSSTYFQNRDKKLDAWCLALIYVRICTCFYSCTYMQLYMYVLL